MSCPSDTGQNKSTTAELFKVCWFGGAEAVFTAEQREVGLYSQPKWPHLKQRE